MKNIIKLLNLVLEVYLLLYVNRNINYVKKWLNLVKSYKKVIKTHNFRDKV